MKRVLIVDPMRNQSLFLVLALTTTMGAPPAAFAAWPPSKCTHVEVLDSGDTDKVSWRFDGTVTAIDGTLEDARSNQLETLGTALDLLPDFVCQAVRRVAFVNRPPDKSVLEYLGLDKEEDSVIEGWTTQNDRQNIVYLNSHSLSAWNESSLGFSEEAENQAIHRAVHEATHTAVRLLQSQQKADPVGDLQERPDPDLWPEEAQQLAREIIESNRLNTGVLREWQRIHDAFVAAGMAKGYYGGGWVKKDGFSAEALAGDGFMSAYGGEKAMEDIAEMASWAIVRASLPDSKDSACQLMNSRSGSGVQSADAAVFTKLGFVRTLEFITEPQYKSCAGSLKIDAPAPGFHSYKDGNLNRSYTGNPRAGVGRGTGDDEQWLLANITADGELSTSSGSFPATVELILNVTPPVDGITDPGKRADRMAIAPADVSYPRGVYFIGFRRSPHNRLLIKRQEGGAVIVDVGEGVALVGRASSEFIEGSVFVHRIFNFSGGLLSAIAGDEPVSEESRMTFRYAPQND